MDKTQYDEYLATHRDLIDDIRQEAWGLHQSVGQTYGENLPYGHHLSMVAEAAKEFATEVIANQEDILPVLFAAYFHDSIEDARLTYNDVRAVATRFMTQEQTHIAAEVVYALTNDKGRTRAERAGEHYYAGIRETPYAPFVKLCDRVANMTYSFSQANPSNLHMRQVYAREWPHFLQSITVQTTDSRFTLPAAMLHRIEDLMQRL